MRAMKPDRALPRWRKSSFPVTVTVRRGDGREFVHLFIKFLRVAAILSLVACTGPNPLLRSNAHLQLQGPEATQDDVNACQKKAEAAGLKPGTSRSANAAAGGSLGLIGGAAVGAAGGIIGGATGVAIGAAVGGGLGLIIGLAGGAYKPLEPDSLYADVVVRCLIEKGYEVSGWQ